MTPEELQRRLQAFVGREAGPPQAARDPVNAPMIRHWCDAVDDRNPVYTDPEFAEKSLHQGLVAPPTMLQAWVMPGLRPPGAEAPGAGAMRSVLALLDEAGFTSVVATNCRQEYVRYLHPGDEVSVASEIESISEEKRTALGAGHFVTQRMTFRDRDGETLATMRFRILKFRPPDREAGDEPSATPPPEASSDTAPAPRRGRPRAARTRDSAFFWEGLERGALLIQRCASCGRLQHPPGPMCPVCHALEWDTLEACGRGHVYSYVVAHHPPIPPFAVPNLIALIELEEGTRLVSNLVGVDPAEVEIGMPVQLEITQVEPDLKLPLFRPARRS